MWIDGEDSQLREGIMSQVGYREVSMVSVKDLNGKPEHRTFRMCKMQRMMSRVMESLVRNTEAREEISLLIKEFV